MSTGAIKGAEVEFSNAGHVHVTSCIKYFQLCEHDSEREEESAEFKNMYSPRSPPPLIDTDKYCLPPPPPCHPSASLSVYHAFEVRACAAPPMSITGSGVRS